MHTLTQQTKSSPPANYLAALHSKQSKGVTQQAKNGKYEGSQRGPYQLNTIPESSTTWVQKQTEKNDIDVNGRAEVTLKEAEEELRIIQDKIKLLIYNPTLYSSDLDQLITDASKISTAIRSLADLLGQGENRDKALKGTGGMLIVGAAIPLPEEVITWPLAGLTVLAVLLFTASQADVKDITKALSKVKDVVIRSRKKRRWMCQAKCNVAGSGKQCYNLTVEGFGVGHSKEDACRSAKRNATQSAPKGCYARHCRCFNCIK